MVEDKDDAKEEIRINNIIKEHNPPIPYVIKLIKEGTGDFIRGEKHYEKQRYFILEYASKGDLYKYIKIPDRGFGEDCGKLLFYKILLGIKGCHSAGVFHLDLKIENIVIDENDGKYNPKICDFGLATDDKGELDRFAGTLSYEPPQLIEGKNYTGEKADIFYLGSMLFIIVVGKPCFLLADGKDYFYGRIKENNLPEYFNRIQNTINSFNTLSQEFKYLFASMLAYEEENRPPLDAIMNNSWFDDIRNDKKKRK